MWTILKIGKTNGDILDCYAMRVIILFERINKYVRASPSSPESLDVGRVIYLYNNEMDLLGPMQVHQLYNNCP